MTDAEFRLTAEAQGSAVALTAILQGHQGAVRGFLRRLYADAAEADDVAQDVFLTAFA